MVSNCYVHIPFCKSKCNYCSFISFPCLDKIPAYMFSLYQEISQNYRNEKLNTLYIGGGTPSLIPVSYIEKLLKKFHFSDNYECTMEVNPDDVNSNLISCYSDFGINRISMGVQSFNDSILSFIARRHSAQIAISSIDIIKNSGIDNISIDLIYGLPSQSLSDFLADINIAVNLPVTHISLYGLKIEDNCYFSLHPPKNLPDDDLQADMYLAACEILKTNGFLQYEISNFAKNNNYSMHNLNYWNNSTYYGYGVAAHGYVDGYRYYNSNSIDEYIENPSVSEYAHFLTDEEKLQEEIFLGLRKTQGVFISKINKKFNINFLDKHFNIIRKYSPEFLVLDGDNLKLTTKGFMVSNIILAEFI